MHTQTRLLLKITYASERFFSGDDRGLRWFYLWQYKLNPSYSFIADWDKFRATSHIFRCDQVKLRYTSICNYMHLLKLRHSMENYKGCYLARKVRNIGLSGGLC
jgi:hypothetical protein